MANDVSLKVVLGGVDSARNQVSSLANTIEIATLKSRLWGDALTGAAKRITSAITGTAASSIQMNANIETASKNFEFFFKSADKARNVVEALRKESQAKALDFGDTIQAGKMLAIVADQSEEKLMKLMHTAQMLQAVNPDRGISEAAFSIREAMSSDFMSLIERFNIPRNLINKIKAEGKEGIDVVNEALKRLGVNMDLVTAKANTFQGKWTRINSFWAELKMNMGKGIFDVVNQEMSDGLQHVDTYGERLQDLARIAGDVLGEELKQLIDGALTKFKEEFGSFDEAGFRKFSDAVKTELREWKTAAESLLAILQKAADVFRDLKFLAGAPTKLGESLGDSWSAERKIMQGQKWLSEAKTPREVERAKRQIAAGQQQARLGYSNMVSAVGLERDWEFNNSQSGLAPKPDAGDGFVSEGERERFYKAKAASDAASQAQQVAASSQYAMTPISLLQQREAKIRSSMPAVGSAASSEAAIFGRAAGDFGRIQVQLISNQRMHPVMAT